MKTRLVGAARLVSLLLLAPGVGAVELPSGEELAARINARPRADRVSRIAVLELFDAKGRERGRRMRSFWKLGPDAKRLAFFVEEPIAMRHDAFLAVDWFDSSRDDDQWIYRAQNQRANRIGNPRRRESFLGSDFSLEDIKKEDRVEVGEHEWKTLGTVMLNGRLHYQLEQRPASAQLAEDLGYARILNLVDAELWVRRRIEFFDAEDASLKTFEIVEIREIDGIPTAVRIEARNADGHRSTLRFEEVDFASEVPDEVFTVRTLQRERLGRTSPDSR